MHILLTNDDGITADPLWVLYHELAHRHRVTVVAPDRERSAVGHAITLNTPLRHQEIIVNGNGQGVAVNGTPADCVKLALNELLAQKPDLVIAGINPGSNVGINVNYSGTVAAAREAVLNGLPGLAVSINSHHPRYVKESARITARLIDCLWQDGLPENVAVNINFPDLSSEEMAGVQWCRQNSRTVTDKFQKQIDPRGNAYLWYTFPEQHKDDRRHDANMMLEDTLLLHHGYITLTPIQCDLTDEETLKRCAQNPVAAFWEKYQEK